MSITTSQVTNFGNLLPSWKTFLLGSIEFMHWESAGNRTAVGESLNSHLDDATAYYDWGIPHTSYSI